MTASIYSPLTPAAIRSQSCGSERRVADAGAGQSLCLRRGGARQHRRQQRPGLCLQHRCRWDQLHRLHPQPGRAAAPDSWLDGDAAGRVRARRRGAQRGQHEARRHAGQHLADRQLHPRSGRAPARGPGITVRRAGRRPVRQRVPPHQSRQLFVANAHNGSRPRARRLGVSTTPNGTLSPIAGSPFADFQTAPCWLVVSPDGQYVYALDTGSAEISSYAIARDGTLTPVEQHARQFHPRCHRDRHRAERRRPHAYLNMAKVNGVGEFAVHGGTVRQLPGSPVPASGSGSTVGITTS